MLNILSLPSNIIPEAFLSQLNNRILMQKSMIKFESMINQRKWAICSSVFCNFTVTWSNNERIESFLLSMLRASSSHSM